MEGIATLVAVLSLITSAPAASLAQDSAGGSISGHVHSSGGVAVPGATVVLVNPQTGERKGSWTDEAGNYSFSSVPPGTYKLQVSLVGFRDDVREPIPVVAGKSLKVNVALIMAYGNAPANAQGETSGRKGNSNPESLPPQVRERFENMAGGGATNVAGEDSLANVRFAGNGGAGQSTGEASGAESDSPDLQASAANSFLLSGSVAQAAMPGENRENFRERFRELRRQQQGEVAPGFGGGQGQGGGPGFGGGGGGPIFMMMGGRFGGRRPQINRIRGNVFEQYSNSALDASPYPLNVPASEQIPSYSERAGIGFGGPLTIPGIYHGKDKTSFFFNYNMGRSRTPFDSFATVPTLDERNGDFSKTVIASGPLAGTTPILYNPESNPSGPRTPFQGNMIPSRMMDSAALGLLPCIQIGRAHV